jgi:molybdate transport repressor ModE-like protein
MDWDGVKIFLAVARQGQIVGAARRLGLNHATVARQLQALEASIGAVLFDRRPSGSVLTQAGERLLPIAERVEAELLAASASLEREAADVAGTVRIGAPDGLGNMFLAAELGLLARTHPNLQIEFVPLPRAFSLSRREADIAIVLDRPAQGRLVVAKLTDYTLGVYGARAYLAGAPPIAHVGDLAGHVVVTGVEDFAYAAALDYAGALDGHSTRHYRCASVIGQRAAIRAGAGIGILHDFMAAADPDLVRLLPEIAFERSYWMISHPDTHDVRRVAACREFLMRRCREERRRFLPQRGAAAAPRRIDGAEAG